MVKNPPANAGDTDLIPGLGRFSGERNGNPLHYSCLEKPIDRGAWQASPQGHKELDTTEQLTLNACICIYIHIWRPLSASEMSL